MPPQPTISATDSQLGTIVEELIERLKRGENVNADFLNANYPEAAANLIEMLPTIRGLVDLSESDTTPPSDEHLLAAGIAPDRRLGDFRIIRQIGRGGMGVVYEAEQLSLGRHVALKVLPLAAVLDERNLQRFKNEAQAAASLDHPHIVDVYGVGCERGVHFYAMRLINGCTLADLIDELRQRELPEKGVASHNDATLVPHNPKSKIQNRKSSTVPLALLSTERTGRKPAFYSIAAELGLHVADALAHAHDQGIVHRDIKPSNLMLDSHGKVWVTDFGLAHIEANQNLTMTGDLLGTLRYMSPEQALGQRSAVDQRSDIYSLGATLYELLTLHPVIAGDDRGAILRKISAGEFPSPRRINPQIPPDLETILLKMLEKDAASRYASAAELADDFRRFIVNLPIAAKRASIWRRAARWSQRHRSLAAALLLATVTTVAGISAMTGWQARENAAQQIVVEQAFEASLSKVDNFGQLSRWDAALTELQQAENVARGRKLNATLTTRAAQSKANAQMAVRLQEIRLLAATMVDSEFDFAAADALYEQAFREFGMEVGALSPRSAAELIARSPIQVDLVDAITHWAITRKQLKSADAAQWQALLRIANDGDSDPWRQRLRRLLESPEADSTTLMDLARDVRPADQPPAALFLLLQLLAAERTTDSALPEQLRKIEQQYTGDFWVQFGLGGYWAAVAPPRWDASLRHYATALGIRPGSAAVHNNLGVVLKRLRRPAEAADQFRQAIKLAPSFALPLANLGVILTEEKRFDEAIPLLQASIDRCGDLPIVHRHLGVALAGRGDFDSAVIEFRHAIELQPEIAANYAALADACQSIGQFDEAIVAYRQAIEIDPKSARSRSNLGAVLELFGRRQEALAEYQQAVALDPQYSFACRNLARCLQRLGKFTEALTELDRGQSAMAPNSQDKKRFAELIDDARQFIDISASPIETSIDDPQSTAAIRTSKIALVRYYQRQFEQSQALFADAFRLDPSLAATHRYDAACVALLAARRSLVDPVASQSPPESHRQQALTWLNDQLASLRQRAQIGSSSDIAAVRRTLAQWRIDPDLEQIRDDASIQNLPPTEQQLWTALWGSVSTLAAELRPH